MSSQARSEEPVRDLEVFRFYAHQPLYLAGRRLLGGRFLRLRFEVHLVFFLALFLLPRYISAFLTDTPLWSKADQAYAVPALRDWCDWVICALMALLAALIIKEWKRLAVLPRSLHRAGLTEGAVGETAFNDLLRRQARIWGSVRVEIVSLVLGALIASAVMWTFGTVGLYPYDGPRTEEVAKAHYAQWWANPQAHVSNYLVVFSTYIIYGYLLIRNTFAGIPFFLVIKDLRGRARKAETTWLSYPGLRPPLDEPFRQIRGTIRELSFVVMIFFVTIAVAVVYVSLSGFIVVALLSFYVLYHPIALGLPAFEVNREVRLSALKHVEAQRGSWASALLEAKKEAEAGSGDLKVMERLSAKVVIMGEKCRLAEHLPTEVIGFRRRVQAFALYIAPVVALVLTLVKK